MKQGGGLKTLVKFDTQVAIPSGPRLEMPLEGQMVRFGGIAAPMGQHEVVRQIAVTAGPGNEVVDIG
jgi:hypothetical protein